MHIIFLTILVASAVFYTASATPPTTLGETIENVARTSPLEYLGTVSGRAYFADFQVNMNWTEARSYCDSFNLRLASIESATYGRFLGAALSNRTSGAFYWTSGRESRLDNSFVWDHSGQSPTATAFQGWYHYPPDQPYHYCTVVWSNPANRLLYMSTDLCFRRMYGLICQAW